LVKWGSVESDNLITILNLAFALGLVHALDADHVIAVSALASQPQAAQKNPRWYGLRWSLGHGVTLLLSGILVLGVGIAIPPSFGYAAESLVGLVLVGMGIGLVYRLRRRRSVAGTGEERSRGAGLNDTRHRHGATAIGALHGMAGSAPLLALVPAAASGAVWSGLMYLLLFNVGVLASMLLCTTTLGVVFKRLNQAGKRVLDTVRYAIAGGSVIAGGYLLKSVF